MTRREVIHPQALNQLKERAARCSELERLAAEVVAELRERSSEANRLSALGYGDAPSYHTGRDKAFDSAADLVESMLGLARCGEGCDGNCELTASGPTKSEAGGRARTKVVDLFVALKESLDEAQRYCSHCGDKLTKDQKQCDDEAATGAGHFICGGAPVLFSGLSLELQKRWLKP